MEKCSKIFLYYHRGREQKNLWENKCINMNSWVVLRWDSLNCGWWTTEQNSVPWREQACVREVTRVNIFLPSSDGRWLETNGNCHSHRLEEGMGDDRRKWGSSSSHVVHLGFGGGTVCPGEGSGSYQQSWSTNSVHWIVSNYFIFLILTSFSLYETKDGLII